MKLANLARIKNIFTENIFRRIVFVENFLLLPGIEAVQELFQISSLVLLLQQLHRHTCEWSSFIIIFFVKNNLYEIFSTPALAVLCLNNINKFQHAHVRFCSLLTPFRGSGGEKENILIVRNFN